VSDRYRQIQRLEAQHALSVLCPLLTVSRSGYYAWRRRTPSPRQQEDARLLQELHQAFGRAHRAYGRPRLTRALRAQGHSCGERRVGRLMREAGLCARTRRRFRPRTTDSRHEGPIAPNRLPERTPTLTAPDQIWAVDMTYLETTTGWLYLAIVLDLYSRRIVGWAFDSQMPAALPQAALAMALHHRRPPRGLLHHSDRGSQYASAAYRALLRTHGLVASMSRTANPYDNAAVESFFSTLKIECCRHHPLASPALTKALVFDYIETFYNRTRLHSALGFRSPVDFESLTP
jgi:transposase InsO family protein